MNGLDFAMRHPLDELAIEGCVRGLLGDMHRATTDHGAATCARTEFRQGHPNGHIVTFSLLMPNGASDPVSRRVTAAL
ncbi:hypothetical protein [Sphingomonas sp. GC_Shp_2]|uniref:hypothetical protein n=2 Tax=unclassified Sphingomonas TaxID=196159 RepID=UPI002269BD76|nr:hypothetical protein [Sphingomonas sp. GC_Shp_2]